MSEHKIFGKIRLNLFSRVIIAIAIGALLGMVLPEVLVRIVKTFNVLFAQILKFIVPLLVLGLVTPAIANVGKGAGKMLVAVLAIAYASTICAGFFSYAIGSNVLPAYLSHGELTADSISAGKIASYFDLKIPPLCDTMTALVLSFMIGVGIIFTSSSALKRGFDEFGNIIKFTIDRVIIPLLPWYIFSMICEMSARGVIASILGSGLKIILTGIILSILYLIIQYTVACIIARRNPFKALWNMLPAYFTAFSICSSSAVIPVTTECTKRNGISEDIVDFTIPLCSTVHMCGSTIKLAVSAIAVAYMSGTPISFALYANFVMLQGIAAVAAPGVMGGVLMASIGIMESVLGFSADQTALVMTLYLALDGYGPACNVTGDGAIAIVIDKYFGRK